MQDERKHPAPVIEDMAGLVKCKDGYLITFLLEGGGTMYLPISNAHLKKLALQFVKLNDEMADA
jgi:hypothetical protein